MIEKKSARAVTELPTRREAIAGFAIALGSLAAVPAVWGKPQQKQPKMEEKPSTGAEGLRTSLHQEIDLNASPQRIYEILLDSKQFSAFSGEPAEISRDAGGAFKMFGGKIEGRNIELVGNQRIVQAWRPAYWEPGVYTLVKFELKGQGNQTKLVLDHTGFPEGNYGHLYSGWHERYWEPLKKYLAA